MINASFRQIKISDIRQFYHLRLEALEKYPSNFKASLAEEKNIINFLIKGVIGFFGNKNKVVCFGAFIDGKIVGTVALHQIKSAKLEHYCEIWGMYVKENYRNQALGKQLLEIAINHAEMELRCSFINLVVESNNIPAKNLYETYGFKVWGTQHKALRVGGFFYDESHMFLTL